MNLNRKVNANDKLCQKQKRKRKKNPVNWSNLKLDKF